MNDLQTAPRYTLSHDDQNGNLQFQAEARQVLDLMIHSLYTNKEIFLARTYFKCIGRAGPTAFRGVEQAGADRADEKLEIWIESDSKAGTLTISDNGIGMSREEVIANIGTIAKSGTRELLQTLREKQSLPTC